MTPEQAIGSALATIDRIRDRGIGIRRRGRYQAFGAVAMDQLRDAGYVVLHRVELDALKTKLFDAERLAYTKCRTCWDEQYLGIDRPCPDCDPQVPNDAEST